MTTLATISDQSTITNYPGALLATALLAALAIFGFVIAERRREIRRRKAARAARIARHDAEVRARMARTAEACDVELWERELTGGRS